MGVNGLGLATFLAIAFVVAWVNFFIVWRRGISPRNPLFQLAILPGGFAPAIGAAVVRQWVTGEGFASAGLSPQFGAWPYYLLAWLLPLVVALIVLALALLLGVSRPDFSLRRSLTLIVPEEVDRIPVPNFVTVILGLLSTSVLATPLLFGEEFGWRGYLQTHLFVGQPLLAAVATGLIWGVWHYPLILMGYQFPEHRRAGLAVFTVTAVLLSIIFGWLYEASGTIWTVSLAHASANALGGSLLMLLFMGGRNWIYTSFVGILGWAPLGSLCAWIVLTGRLA